MNSLKQIKSLVAKHNVRLQSEGLDLARLEVRAFGFRHDLDMDSDDVIFVVGGVRDLSSS